MGSIIDWTSAHSKLYNECQNITVPQRIKLWNECQ